LILALSRKVAFYHHATKTGVYDLKAGPTLRRIEGQTLGIVGLGNIGIKLVEKARGLGMRILATSRSRSKTVEGVQFVELDELLAQSDYVSLHVPATAETRNMIGAAQLARMKPSAYLINTARGAIVDHAALAAALASGKLAGAALDVQETEPPDLSKPPYNDPRVIVTPHAAFVSAESLDNLRRRVSQQVVDRVQGRVPENVVNAAAIGLA
jgi:D-3-phosphoglycerate dehydrogenase